MIITAYTQRKKKKIRKKKDIDREQISNQNTPFWKSRGDLVFSPCPTGLKATMAVQRGGNYWMNATSIKSFSSLNSTIIRSRSARNFLKAEDKRLWVWRFKTKRRIRTGWFYFFFLSLMKIERQKTNEKRPF